MYLKKKDIIDKIFYITIAVYFFFSTLTLSMLESYHIIAVAAKLIRYACYLLFFAVVACNIVNLNQKISIKSICMDVIDYFRAHILLICVLLNTVLILLTSGEKTPLIIVLFIWACSFYDFKKVIKVYFATSAAFLLSTWGLSLLEAIPEILIWREDRVRFSLGYVYPLETMTHFLFMVICFMYIMDKKFGVREYVIVNMLGYLLYVVTDARTSYYLLVIGTTLGLIYSKTQIEKLLKKIRPEFFYAIVLLCFAVSIGAGFLYNDNVGLWAKVDDMLSGRIHLMNEAFHRYGISALGQRIEWVGFGGSMDTSALDSIYNFVDCAYAKILLDYGIVFSLFVLVGYCCIYKQAIQKQDWSLVLAICIILVVSIMEPRLISIEVNPFMLLLGGLFTQKNKSKIKFI